MSDDISSAAGGRERATVHSIGEGRKDPTGDRPFVVPRNEDGSLKLTINAQYRPDGMSLSRDLPLLEGDPRELDTGGS